MTDDFAAGQEVSVGRVLARGFGVVVDNPLPVLGIAFLLGALPSILINLFELSLRTVSLDNDYIAGYLALVVGSVLVGLVLQLLVQGSLVRATLAYARGERATIGECVSASLAVLPALIGVAILMGLGVGLGLMLLLIPGIMLYVIWSVASPALVAERTGVFEALARSGELTRGARWKVFGVEVILLIAYYIFVGVFTAIAVAVAGLSVSGLTGNDMSVSFILTTAISSTLVNAVWSTVQTSLYVELKTAKEGPPEQALEEIFA